MQPNQGVFRCHHLPAHASEPSLRGLDNGDKNLLLQDFGGVCVCVLLKNGTQGLTHVNHTLLLSYLDCSMQQVKNCL
jgi:hypothetical protein